MALSNWLTRNEWSAAYFAYLTGVDFGPNPDKESFPWPIDLSSHLRIGICLLDEFGYKDWGGIKVPDNRNFESVHKAEDSRYGVAACTAEGDNSNCLVEIMEGTLDHEARAKEVLVWMEVHPELNFPILRRVCQVVAEKPG